MSNWNDFFSSGIFSARARTYWIYRAIQAYDLANRATLKLYPALGTNVASSCGYIGPQYEAYVEIQYKDTTPKPLPKWP